MAVQFRDLNGSSTKLQTNGSNAAATYAKNAAAAQAAWSTNTAASEPNYVAGVQAAAARGAFGKGVGKSGTRYSSQVTAVGQNRFSDGMSKAGPRWLANFQPMAAAVAGTDLGPRGVRGSAQNKTRAAAMSDAWHAARLAKTA
jgi:hypothetical protein